MWSDPYPCRLFIACCISDRAIMGSTNSVIGKSFRKLGKYFRQMFEHNNKLRPRHISTCVCTHTYLHECSIRVFTGYKHCIPTF